MQGSLQDFRLAEILQLVAGQQKTGLLRVESHGAVLTFYFSAGTLVSCRDRRHAGQDPLVNYVSQCGLVDPDIAMELARKCEESRTDFADRLLENRLITSEELERALDDLMQDLVYRTFNWREGNYRFILGDQFVEGLKHQGKHKVESLLMEAARRADEWPRLLARVPGPQVLLAAVKRVPDDLDPTSRELLARLTQPMRVGDLVACGRIPEYDVYEIVSNCVEHGILQILEVPAAPAAPAAEPAKAAPVRPVRTHEKPVSVVGTVVWILALATLVLSVGAGLLLSTQRRSLPPSETAVALARSEAQAAVELGLETYRALQGDYPDRLEDLTQLGLVDAQTLRQASVRVYEHRRRRRFELRY